MNILVIGGAGYIGSHVVYELLKNGNKVTVFDNLSTGLKENLFSDSEFVLGDILDYGSLVETMDGNFDAVIHLAALKAVEESMLKPELYAENNIIGTINILNAMVKNKIGVIIFSSTAAIYGTPVKLPLDENHPLNPENFYGFTKLEIERILSWYSKLKNIRYGSLRYFNAAGYDPDGKVKGLEQNPGNLIPVIMEVATGKRDKLIIFGNDYKTQDGTCIRDYIHVTDLAWAHQQALRYIKEKDEDLTVNLATGHGYSVMDVYKRSLEICKVNIAMEYGNRREGDPPLIYATAKKAEALLGFKPKYSDLDTIIKTTWQTYK